MDSFLIAVQEFVEDESQIVTCKRLCRHLSVSVRQSQDILGAYIESCAKQKKKIQVSYLITGRSAEGIVVKLVTDRNLDDFKSKLQLVLNKSLYSVQKSGEIDNAVLYNADSDLQNSDQLNQFSGIEYKSAKKLPKNALKKLRSTSDGKEQASDLEKQFAKSKNPPKPKTDFFKKQSESVKSGEVTQKINKTKSEAKKTVQKKSGLSGFLTKKNKDPFDQSSHECKTEVELNPESETESSKENLKIQSAEIAGKDSSDTQLPKEDSDMKIDDFSDAEDFDSIVKTDTTMKSKPNIATKSRDVHTKSKPKTSKKEAKKRKRIEWLSSSSEDDDDVEIPSPKKTFEKAPSPEKTIDKSPMKENNKQMKRVLKTRTFVDDDGCMVTEKSYELEECDQPAITKDKKTAAPQMEKKKKVLSTAAQPKKQKQASIMGFFKKK